MDQNLLKNKWKDFRADVQSRWDRLTNNDLAEIDGDYGRLRKKLRERYGIPEDELDRSLAELDRELKDLNRASRRMEAGE